MKNADNLILSRIREKAVFLGVEKLSEKELLSLLIKSGDDLKDVNTLSENLLRRYGSLKDMANISCEQLYDENRGMTQLKALTLKAAFELGKRCCTPTRTTEPINNSFDIAMIAMPLLMSKDNENFMVAILNTKHKLIGIETVSVGILNSSLVHARELFRLAISKNAYGVILIHNHPSGDPTPSNEDVSLTKNMYEAGRILGIEVLDHVVIGAADYFSFADNGLDPFAPQRSLAFVKNNKLA